MEHGLSALAFAHLLQDVFDLFIVKLAAGLVELAQARIRVDLIEQGCVLPASSARSNAMRWLRHSS
jgi:hypothetical protein